MSGYSAKRKRRANTAPKGRRLTKLFANTSRAIGARRSFVWQGKSTGILAMTTRRNAAGVGELPTGYECLVRLVATPTCNCQ